MGEKYRFKRKPYKHQVDALRKLFANGWGGALLMEPRTGKTKVCIDYASILHQKGEVSRVLIVCPAAVIDVWIEALKDDCPFKHRITVWDRKGRKKVDLPPFGRDILDFVILNYDAFSTPGRATGRREDGSIKRSRRVGGRYELSRALRNWQPHLIILDESHRIKSRNAKKSGSLIRLGPVAQYRVIATGTVVTKAKRVFDLYSQWKFLNPNSPLIAGMDLATFKEVYGQWTNRNGYPQFLRPRNQKQLHRLVHAESFSVTRDECYDLPPAYPDQIIHVDLEESASVYDQMAEEMVAKIKTGEVTEASIKLVQYLRFAQITSGIAKTAPTPDYPEGRWVRVGSEKLTILKELLEDWFEQEEKVVICARFRADIVSIAQLCEKLKVKPQILMGGQKREERTRAIAQFKAQQGAAAFIMNPQAGSEGIDLRSASTMVWYSLTQSFVNYTQCRDRIALSGKANRYVYLLGRGTYDEIQYEALQEDGDVVSMIHASPDRLLRSYKQ